jgi:hypothetical protein
VFDAIDDDRSGSIDEEELMEGVSAANALHALARLTPACGA